MCPGVSEKSLDDAEAVAVLHSLYAMTTLGQGREGIVDVLGHVDLIPVLLTFIQANGNCWQISNM